MLLILLSALFPVKENPASKSAEAFVLPIVNFVPSICAVIGLSGNPMPETKEDKREPDKKATQESALVVEYQRRASLKSLPEFINPPRDFPVFLYAV